ncbi:MAG: family 78 glycoside hydrolase catalytic domain, partial [Bacteroidales bacterium]|nr:family 78 glycoside hydrolase catalytic domain [Bacteroidales bacterium]
MKQRFYLFLLAVFLLASCSKVKVENLRVEQMVSPLNVSRQQPRLSWVIRSDTKEVMQTAYHILVASSPQLLSEGKADMWDSKKISSDESIWVPYDGKQLQSGQRLYWKVKVYTTQGESPWSEPAEWGMGLLSSSDWKAQWIGHDGLFEGENVDSTYTRLAARYLRKEFRLPEDKKVKNAVVHICGLGLFELHINGQRVGEDVMTPGPTDFRQRVFYNTYDVTRMLDDEENAIGVILGNGRYVTMRHDDVLNQEDMFGMPKLILQMDITFADGSHQQVCSDTTWMLTADGPIRANNEYDGEEYDARMDLDDWDEEGYDYEEGHWMQAQRVQGPAGILVGHPNDNIRVKKTIDAISLTQVGDNRYIVDFGQNLSGWAVVRMHDTREGDTITMRFAEILKDNDSNLYTANLRSALATDRYIADGDEDGERSDDKSKRYEDEWHPTFVIHGFRFMEISGLRNPQLKDFRAELVFDDLETSGQIETSNSIINQIYRNAWWGIADNYRGMPMDCCQRDERMPWLGDRTAGCYGEGYVFDINKLYSKWMTDICQSQQETGNLPSVCPTYWRIMSPNMT